MKQSTAPVNEAGNILFLILLAVVLFAALAYAVTGSQKGQTKSGSSESASAAAGSIVQFAGDVETFMTRARVVDGVAADEFTFQVDSNAASTSNYLETSGSASPYNNNSNCVRAACRVFKPYNPNGIAAQLFENYADPVNLDGMTGSNGRGGNVFIRQLIIQHVGTPAPEVVLFIPGLQANICNEINRLLGFTTSYINTTAIETIETTATSRPASYAPSGTAILNTTNTFGEEATMFAGRKTFCAPLNNGGNGVGSRLGFLHVLIER